MLIDWKVNIIYIHNIYIYIHTIYIYIYTLYIISICNMYVKICIIYRCASVYVYPLSIFWFRNQHFFTIMSIHIHTCNMYTCIQTACKHIVKSTTSMCTAKCLFLTLINRHKTGFVELHVYQLAGSCKPLDCPSVFVGLFDVQGRAWCWCRLCVSVYPKHSNSNFKSKSN